MTNLILYFVTETLPRDSKARRHARRVKSLSLQERKRERLIISRIRR